MPMGPSPWTAPDNAPAWARGKTSDEILGIANQLYGTLEQAVRGQGQPQQPQPAPAQQAPASPAFDPDGYLTGRDFERVAPQYVQQYIQPQIQQSFEMMADVNLANAKREHPDIFAKYGPEVLGYLSRLPKTGWTGQNLDMVVKLVKADHVDEMAREHATRLVAEMEPTLRSGGAGGANGVPISQPNADYTLASAKIPTDWKERAAKVGLTENAVDEFCRANEMSRADFFRQFEQTAITEVTRHG